MGQWTIKLTCNSSKWPTSICSFWDIVKIYFNWIFEKMHWISGMMQFLEASDRYINHAKQKGGPYTNETMRWYTSEDSSLYFSSGLWNLFICCGNFIPYSVNFLNIFLISFNHLKNFPWSSKITTHDESPVFVFHNDKWVFSNTVNTYLFIQIMWYWVLLFQVLVIRGDVKIQFLWPQVSTWSHKK